MLTWKKTIITSVIIGAALYGGLSYARIIPGVDEPYDPGNYWSLSSISWPDSAPSTYFLRDVSRQGGSVYDPWRDKEQQAKNKKVESWLQAQIQQTLNKILSMTPWGAAMTQPIETGIQILHDNNKSGNIGKVVDAQKDEKLYATPSKPGTPDKDGKSQYVAEPERIKYLQQRLAETGRFIGDLDDDEKRVLDLVNQALDLTANAQSTVEVQQARNLLNGIKAAEQQKTNRIIAEINSLKVLEAMEEMDATVKAKQINNANKLYVYDPMNPTKIDEESYKRPEPMGMLDFK